MFDLDMAMVVDGWQPHKERWEHFERRALARFRGALKQHNAAIHERYADRKRRPRHLDEYVAEAVGDSGAEAAADGLAAA